MKLYKLGLVIAAGVLIASSAFAATWDVTAQFNTLSSNNASGWSYGYTPSYFANWDNNITFPNYSFTPFTASQNYIGSGNGDGFEWRAGYSIEDPLELIPYVGLMTGNGNWHMTLPGVYMRACTNLNNTGAGYASVIRWTAAAAGAYSYEGAIMNTNPGDWDGAQFNVYKIAADGSQTLIQHFENIQADPLEIGSTGISLAAGESLDFVDYSFWPWGRPYTLVDFRVSGGEVVTPEPGSMLALGGGLFGLVGFAIRRRK